MKTDRKTAEKMTRKSNREKYNRRLPAYRDLAKMVPTMHWPKKPEPFFREDSPILQMIVARHGVDFKEANAIFSAAGHLGVVKFDADTATWCGSGRKPIDFLTENSTEKGRAR